MCIYMYIHIIHCWVWTPPSSSDHSCYWEGVPHLYVYIYIMYIIYV